MGLGKFTEDATVIPCATLGQMTVQFALESVSSLSWNTQPGSLGTFKKQVAKYLARNPPFLRSQILNLHKLFLERSLGDFYEYSYRSGRSDQDVPLG